MAFMKQVRIAADSIVGLLRLKSFKQHGGGISTAEVLRLRATSAVSRDQSVRRFAPTASRGRQDDDSVGEPEEKQKVAPLRFAPGSTASRDRRDDKFV
jgi:hypothetical protein